MQLETFRFAVLGTAVLAVMLWSYLQWRQSRFARRNAISTLAELDQFKAIVKEQMIGVLLLAPLALTPLALLLASLFLGPKIGLPEKAFFSVYAALIAVGASASSSSEQRLRALSTESDWLRTEFDRVVRTWRGKLFPDW
jgi:hypothetical protein